MSLICIIEFKFGIIVQVAADLTSGHDPRKQKSK